MPRRAVRALRVGDSVNLSNNYWTLHKILNTREFEYEMNNVYLLEEHELVYLYWELVHTKIYSKEVKAQVKDFREILIDEFMNRKYKRGRYKNVEIY